MPAQPTELESYFLELVNAARAEAGVQPLTFDSELLTAADDHSAWMDATDTRSHTGANDSSPQGRIAAAGYEASGWGENLAHIWGDSLELNRDAVEQLHEMLMNSPDRKSTRLNSSHANISYAVFCLKKKHLS